MKAALLKAWQSRAPHERVVIAALAVVLGLASYMSVIYTATRGRAQLTTSVAALRTQAALLDQQASEHQRLRATAAPPVSPTDLRTLVQARTDAARLSSALTRIDAPDAEHVQVVFGAVSFADLVGWIAALQAQHVRLESARIEALSAPGMVSATATLTRARAE